MVTTSTAARSLYLSLGFEEYSEEYGVQRKALKLDDGRYLDEELMALWL